MNTTYPVALVTGASSGIGETFARKLAGKGYRLILVARRKERLENLAAELIHAEVLSADLAVDSDLKAVEQRIASEPRLEFLVNNAGFGVPGLFWEANAEAQDRMHRVHINAIEQLTRGALKGMVKRRKGNVINVSSVAGFLHTPYSVSYCSTKAWINSFTEGLYIELKGIHSPVRVQALCPGFTHSEFHDVIRMDRSRIPRSLWMTAEDVVDASLRGLERNRMIVVPGWRYRLFLAIFPRIPRFLRHRLSIKYGMRSQAGN
jgi:uncharacterized protein